MTRTLVRYEHTFASSPNPWYDGFEGGVLCPEPSDELRDHGTAGVKPSTEGVGTGDSLAFTDEVPGVHGQQLHCACDACLAEREQIRKQGLGVMSGETRSQDDSWADRSWDGPLAKFPGASGNDGSYDEGGRR